MRRALALSVACFAAHCLAADYRVDGNIRYDQDPATVLHILQPRAPALKKRPIVVLIHKGNWVLGPEDLSVDPFAVPFHEHDFAAVVVEYHKGDEKEESGDVQHAVAWIRDHADRFKLNPDQIVMLGTPETARLALMSAMLPESADGPAHVAAVVLLPTAGAPDEQGSLMTKVHKGLPPVLSIQGDADRAAYEASARLIQAWKAAGNDAELVTVRGARQKFTPEQMEKLWPQVFKWLKKHKVSS